MYFDYVYCVYCFIFILMFIMLILMFYVYSYVYSLPKKELYSTSKNGFWRVFTGLLLFKQNGMWEEDKGIRQNWREDGWKLESGSRSLLSLSLLVTLYLCLLQVTFIKSSLRWPVFSASPCLQWKMLAISAGQAESPSETVCCACVLIANFWFNIPILFF